VRSEIKKTVYKKCKEYNTIKINTNLESIFIIEVAKEISYIGIQTGVEPIGDTLCKINAKRICPLCPPSTGRYYTLFSTYRISFEKKNLIEGRLTSVLSKIRLVEGSNRSDEEYNCLKGLLGVMMNCQ